MALSGSIWWDDFVSTNTTLVDYQDVSSSILSTLLGYCPPLKYVAKSDATLREAIRLYNLGRINFESFFNQACQLAKDVRNKEMEAIGTERHSQTMCDFYSTYLIEFATAARQRLIYYLGYEPDFEYSLFAELILRKAMASDTCVIADCFTSTDMQVITITRYRQVLFEQAKWAADRLDLITYVTDVADRIQKIVRNVQ